VQLVMQRHDLGVKNFVSFKIEVISGKEKEET
jgi:hypothetical protein